VSHNAAASDVPLLRTENWVLFAQNTCIRAFLPRTSRPSQSFSIVWTPKPRENCWCARVVDCRVRKTISFLRVPRYVHITQGGVLTKSPKQATFCNDALYRKESIHSQESDTKIFSERRHQLAKGVKHKIELNKNPQTLKSEKNTLTSIWTYCMDL